VTVEQAIALAVQCEKEALAYDKRLSADEVSVATVDMLYLYANSHGFIGSFPHTRHDMSCVLVAKDGDDMQRDYSYSAVVDASMLTPVSAIAKEAAERTIKRLGARRIPTTKVPVIFAAEEARSLIGHFASAISGGHLYRKASFLLDHIGKQVFPNFMHLQDCPHMPKALGSAPFDGNGVATRDNVYIEDGILRMYSLGIYAARKLGLKTTGNAGGMHNLVVRHGNQDLSALIKTMHRGLLVTEVMGQGVNLVTGDYSRGVGGFWIENGEIQFPVHEITIAGKLQDIFAGIIAIGNDVDRRGGVHTGSILINEMMVAGE
jgi:PmbA protein